MRLDKSRRYGMGGPEALTVSDITALSYLMELPGEDQRCSFLDRMQMMDGVYLTQHYSTKKAK